jgi:hypothetical protein
MKLAAGGFDHCSEELSVHESLRLDVRHIILHVITGITDTRNQAAFITQTAQGIPVGRLHT